MSLTRACLGQDWTQDCGSLSNSSQILGTDTEDVGSARFEPLHLKSRQVKLITEPAV